MESIDEVSNWRCMRRRAAKRARKAGVDYDPEISIAALWRRTEGVCCLCDRVMLYPESLEHMIPLVYGGSGLLSNLTITHKGCNSRKGDSTPTYEQWMRFQDQLDRTLIIDICRMSKRDTHGVRHCETHRVSWDYEGPCPHYPVKQAA